MNRVTSEEDCEDVENPERGDINLASDGSYIYDGGNWIKLGISIPATNSTLGCVKIGNNLVSDSTTGTLSLDSNPTVNTIALPSLSNVIKIPEANDTEPQPLVVYLDHEPEEGYVYKTGVLYLIKE